MPQDLARQYIGGLGLSIKLAHTAIKPGAPALAPEAVVVLGVGPLVGTSLPAASRVYAVAKLPAGGAVGWCGGGGVTFGSHFKNCGLDHVVITGRADRPSILRLEDDQARLDDAAEFSGLGIDETIELAHKKYGPCGVLCIGPSGENTVAMAMASIDGMATIGRGGLGAVLGSKNIKAVVATGALGISVADRKAFGKVSRGVFKQMRDYAYLKQWQELGLLKSLPVVPPEYYLSIKKRRVACVSCPIGDKDIIEIPDGPYSGLRVCTSSAVNLFTPTFFGIKDKEQAIKLTSLLDDLGLDLFEFFAVVGLAARLAAQGAIPQDMLPVAIDSSSLESLEYWAGTIAFKQGLGAVMAGGVNSLLEKYGPPEDGQTPPVIKGLSPYVGPGAALSWNLFGTQELGQALDPRGPPRGGQRLANLLCQAAPGGLSQTSQAHGRARRGPGAHPARPGHPRRRAQGRRAAQILPPLVFGAGVFGRMRQGPDQPLLQRRDPGPGLQRGHGHRVQLRGPGPPGRPGLDRAAADEPGRGPGPPGRRPARPMVRQGRIPGLCHRTARPPRPTLKPWSMIITRSRGGPPTAARPCPKPWPPWAWISSDSQSEGDFVYERGNCL